MAWCRNNNPTFRVEAVGVGGVLGMMTQNRGPRNSDPTAIEQRDAAAAAAVAAVTVTYTQTTYTVTSTVVTTVPARTTTELGRGPLWIRVAFPPADEKPVVKTTTATV